jgi:DNA polymerase-1
MMQTSETTPGTPTEVPISKPSRTLLIDGDITLYQIACKVEVATDWGEGMWTLHSDLKQGIPAFDTQIEKYIEDLQADSVKICLTGRANFRKDIFPEYKLNRVAKRKPLILQALREYVQGKYDCLCENALEADDIMGLYSQQCTNTDERIIVSIDKDMRTIPCKLSVDGEEIINISSQEANYNFALQCLTGDSTDNFSGCPGVGPAKARQILEAADNFYWPAIVKAYEKVDLTEDDAIQQARMAYILRLPKDYNFETKEVRKWTPYKIA